MAVNVTVTLSDEQVADARSVLPEGTTAPEALQVLVDVATAAVADQIWDWRVAARVEEHQAERQVDRATHEAVWAEPVEGDPVV